MYVAPGQFFERLAKDGFSVEPLPLREYTRYPQPRMDCSQWMSLDPTLALLVCAALRISYYLGAFSSRFHQKQVHFEGLWLKRAAI